MVIQQNSRKLLMVDILMSETCWAHKKWNKIASDIKLVFYSSNIVNVCFQLPDMRFSLVSTGQSGWFIEPCVEYRVCSSRVMENVVFFNCKKLILKVIRPCLKSEYSKQFQVFGSLFYFHSAICISFSLKVERLGIIKQWQISVRTFEIVKLWKFHNLR